jgi:hypothetical protein
MKPNGLDRGNLRDRLIRVIRQGKPWQPDILLARGDEGLAVVKDYSRRPFLYRVGIGLLSVWNENRMYRLLSGISGVPKGYGKIDRHALVVEYIEGRTASKFKAGEVPVEFFSRLRAIIDEIHSRGVVLCDMRNRRNVLVTASFEPYVIDLVTAFHRGSRFNIIRGFIHRIFYQDDLVGIAKLKSRLQPQLLTPEETRKLREGLFMQREAMAVRDFCVRWLKRLVAHQ